MRSAQRRAHQAVRNETVTLYGSIGKTILASFESVTTLQKRYADEDGMPDIRADLLIPSPDLIAATSRTVAGDDKDRYISEHLQSGVASIS